MRPIREIDTIGNADGSFITSMQVEENRIFVYQPADHMHTDLINYGFSAPLLLVFGDSAFTAESAAAYAEDTRLSQIAAENGGVVIFVNPREGGSWDEEPYGVYEAVLGKTKLTQRGFSHGVIYDDKVPRNKFEEMMMEQQHLDREPEYFILGSTVATYVYATGTGADYIAKYYLKDVKGQTYMGDLGEGDLTMTAATLQNVHYAPVISKREIKIVSVGNDELINSIFKCSCDSVAVEEELDVVRQYDAYIGDFKRWKGRVMASSNYRKEGIVMKPERMMVVTSPDNQWANVARPSHEAGYVLFYDAENPPTDPANPKPLLFCFHGGGDSAVATAAIGGWPEIAKENGFVLCAVEMHMSITAAETMQILEKLQQEYAIDPTAVYVTGFSMGGIKSWDFYQEYPEKIAGCAPMDATVEVGENTQFGKAPRCNDSVIVPVFYNGGESSPLAELPNQAEKCVHRVANLFAVNQVKKDYPVEYEGREQWEDPYYGVRGDTEEQYDDPEFPGSVATVRNFVSADGEVYTKLCSVSNHMHEIRPNTCRLAWAFLKRFRRNADGTLCMKED